MTFVVETCQRLGIERSAAAVGICFGGLQSIHPATSAPELAPKLNLHSCAPSVLPYPDTWPECVAVPLAFGPATQKMTWAAIRRLVASDAALKIMMKSLTRLPEDQWWPQMSQTDQIAARATFNAMEWGCRFINDVRQASRRLSAYRAHIQNLVAAPTLVTASRYDGGVSFRHARNFAETIEHARLYETTAAMHFYWIGGGQADITSAVESFLA